MKYAVLLSCLVALCSAGCGTFNAPSGKVYHLDPLTKTTDYTGTEASVNWKYYYNFCQFVNTTNMGIPMCTKNAYVQQITTTPTCIPLGLNLFNVSELVYGQGVQITYVNEVDLCGTPRVYPRYTYLYLMCAPNIDYQLLGISEPGLCQYNFTIQTKYACPGPLPPPPENDCCTTSSAPGCSDTLLQACVCKSEPGCCTSSWNSTCVSLIESSGCGDCKRGPCCTAHTGGSCQDRQVSRCVCQQMQECCTGDWTSDCVTAVNKLGCGKCQGACCVSAPCNDAAVRECVCKIDSYCCDVQWDDDCVKEVGKYNCSSCVPIKTAITPRTEIIGILQQRERRGTEIHERKSN